MADTGESVAGAADAEESPHYFSLAFLLVGVIVVVVLQAVDAQRKLKRKGRRKRVPEKDI